MCSLIDNACAISRLGNPSATSASTSCSRVVNDSINGSARRAGGREITASASSARSTSSRFESAASLRRSASSSSDARPLRNTLTGLVDRIGENDSFSPLPHRSHIGRSVETTRWGLRTCIPLTLDSWTLADHHGYIDGIRAAKHRDRDRCTDRVPSQPRHERLGILHRLTAKADDHVADQEPARFRRTVRRHVADQAVPTSAYVPRAAAPGAAPSSS